MPSSYSESEEIRLSGSKRAVVPSVSRTAATEITLLLS